MVQIDLPPLVGSREAANEFASLLPDHLETIDVVVNCHDLVSGSPSFADQLVARILVDLKASHLIVAGADAEFAGYFQQSAADRSVYERLVVKPVDAAATA